MTDMKRHGAWKSSTVVEGYIADSVTQKSKTMSRISSEISESQEQNSLLNNSVEINFQNNAPSNHVGNKVLNELTAGKKVLSGNDINFNFSNCSNFNINIHS